MINLNMVSIFRDDGMNIRLLQPVPGCFFQTLPNLAICVDPSPEANPALGSAAPLADSPSLHSILEEPLGDGFVVLGDHYVTANAATPHSPTAASAASAA